MIITFVVLMTAFVLTVQLGLARWQQKDLGFQYRFDTSLAEPGQLIRLTSTVSNYGKLPILFARLREYFRPEITVAGKKFRKGTREYHMDYVFMIPAHRRKTMDLEISIADRGVYTLGKYYLENGDYLGISSLVHSGDMDRKIVVMPRRSESSEVLQTLGGYLGDVSVKRLYLEDPILTVGFRDYTGHEPMKSISWNQTARAGKMLVNQYDHTVESNATVVLNMAGGSREDLEECLRITRTACEELEKKRIAYDFYTNGDIFVNQKQLSWLARGLGKQHYNTIMHGLGTSKCKSLTDFAELAERCTGNRRYAGSGSLILVTPPLKAQDHQVLSRLRARVDNELCLLIGTAGKGGASA